VPHCSNISSAAPITTVTIPRSSSALAVKLTV
jgi:hypothetical protein